MCSFQRGIVEASRPVVPSGEAWSTTPWVPLTIICEMLHHSIKDPSLTHRAHAGLELCEMSFSAQDAARSSSAHHSPSRYKHACRHARSTGHSGSSIGFECPRPRELKPPAFSVDHGVFCAGDGAVIGAERAQQPRSEAGAEWNLGAECARLWTPMPPNAFPPHQQRRRAAHHRVFMATDALL